MFKARDWPNPACDLSALPPDVREEVIRQCRATEGAVYEWYCVDRNHACFRCQDAARAALKGQP